MNSDKLMEVTQDIAERYNRHQGPARCGCDRCAHLANYLAAQTFMAMAEGMAIVLETLFTTDRAALGALKRVRGELLHRSQAADKAAQEHWKECV